MNDRVGFIVCAVVMSCVMGGVLSHSENEIVQEQDFEAAIPPSEDSQDDEELVQLTPKALDASIVDNTKSEDDDLEIPHLELDTSSFVDTQKEELAGKTQIKLLEAKMSKKKTSLENSKMIVDKYHNHIDREQMKIETLVNKLKANTNTMISMSRNKSGDLSAAYQCLSPPTFPKFHAKKIKQVKELTWHYNKLCSSELAKKNAMNEKNSKSTEGRQKIANKQQKSHYAVIEKHQKATSKAKKEVESKAGTEVSTKATSEKKVKAAKEKLDKASEKLGKQKSLSDETKNKESTRKAEIKVKDCEKKKIKENAKKLADEHTIKGLKEKLSKKVKYGKEKEGKIYSKWHKHMSVEKGEKKSEVSLKGNMEKKKKADSALEGKRKLSKEVAGKAGKAKTAAEKSTKEGAKKVKGERKQKEKYAKGTVQEDSHKKETISKEISKKKSAYTKWKENFSKEAEETTAKKGQEYKQKCSEKKVKFSKEKQYKTSAEVKDKAVKQQDDMKPELVTKGNQKKENGGKKGHEGNAKKCKEHLEKSQEKLKKSKASDKAHQKKCKEIVEKAKKRLNSEVKLLRNHKGESLHKKEMSKKVEMKQKFLDSTEKKEKATEKKMKATTEANGKEIKTKSSVLKKTEHEKFSKKVSELKTKSSEKLLKNYNEGGAKTNHGMAARKKANEAEAKNPFIHVKEINMKIKKMQASFKTQQAKKPNYNTIAESKFSMEKEVFFKKYSNATRELGDKKEMFQKRCQLRKEKLTKISMAKIAYSENKGKKSCIETRKSSETNNKLVITYFNNGVKNLKKNCEGLKGVRSKDQKRFVEKVCEGVHRDVQASISKVTKAMNTVGKQSFTFHTKA